MEHRVVGDAKATRNEIARLVPALERAIAYCQSTLSYGRAQEPPPDRHPVLLEIVVEDFHAALNCFCTSW